MAMATVERQMSNTWRDSGTGLEDGLLYGARSVAWIRNEYEKKAMELDQEGNQNRIWGGWPPLSRQCCQCVIT